jgi:nucleotide-binding universal stress UspA family protein
MRILLLLGETNSSVVARRYAFQLAQEKGAELAGLAGIDLSYIEAPMMGRAGTTSYRINLEEQLKRQAEAGRSRLHQAFAEECRNTGIALEWLSFDGDPIGTLYLATETRDLVVTGHDTAFHGNIREQLPDMIAKLLTMSPRPVIVCGDETPPQGDVLVAYDGSLPSMRALQLFALLRLRAESTVHVTAIDPDQETAARRAAGAANYLRSHGYAALSTPVATSVDPTEVIRIEAADRRIELLVMGAYGRNGWRERLFGSTTSKLVESPPCAIFLYH